MGSLDRIAHAVIKADLPGMVEAARSINDMLGEARRQPGTIAMVDGPLPSRETVIQLLTSLADTARKRVGRLPVGKQPRPR